MNLFLDMFYLLYNECEYIVQGYVCDSIYGKIRYIKCRLRLNEKNLRTQNLKQKFFAEKKMKEKFIFKFQQSASALPLQNVLKYL